MALKKVPLYQKPLSFVTVDPEATKGAVVGVNLYTQNGAVILLEDILNPAPTEPGLEFTYWRLIMEIPPNVVALAETATTGLYAVTGAGTSATREIQPTIGRTTVSNGNGVAGDPVIDLAVVVDSGVGAALMKRTIDSFGRVSGSQAATTDDLPEGASNLYFTAARVRATVLTGISFATATAITAADTVLSALGKLQAQITALAASVAGLIVQTITNGDTTHAPSGDAVFDALALKFDKSGGEITGDVVNRGTNTVSSPNKVVLANTSGSPATGTVLQGEFYTNFAGPTNILLRQAAGTELAPLAISSGAVIFRLDGQGHDGAGWANPSSFQMQGMATETFTPTAHGTRWRIRCTAQGSVSFTECIAADTALNLVPGSTDNTLSNGSATNRWSVVYAGTSVISTSDAREKSNIRELNQQELSAGLELAAAARIYQWNEAIAVKGEDSARLHCSPTVQSVISIMESHGLYPFRYGFVCYDEWDETPEQRDPETGEVMQEYRPAGDRYSLRPDELATFRDAALAQNQQAIMERLAALESE